MRSVFGPTHLLFLARKFTDLHRGARMAEREFFIVNLLVRIHFILVMIRWTGLAPWKFEFPFPSSLTSTFLEHGNMRIVGQHRAGRVTRGNRLGAKLDGLVPIRANPNPRKFTDLYRRARLATRECINLKIYTQDSQGQILALA